MTGNPMTGTASDPVAAAYAHCIEVTTREARNFSYGIRLLPPHKRDALCAVYALARRIDDIGDGEGPAQEKRAALAETRARLAGLRETGDDAGDPVLLALGDAARRLPIPLQAFDELIDGVEADVEGRRYHDFDRDPDGLVWYCRCVAGAIGRLSLGAFGGPDAPLAAERADALGIGLQLTNILRDVREDLRDGRRYLPQADLDRFGATLELGPDGEIAGPIEPLVAVVRFEASRARAWYAEGWRLLPMLDPRSAACCSAMSGIYRRLLERIDADPATALRERVSLPPWGKAAVAATSLTGAVLRSRRAGRPIGSRP
ncbi:MAG: phytoene/squalene synthase family protein [Mycobacteriales bacterium]